MVAGAVGSERPGSVSARGEDAVAVDDVGEVPLLLGVVAVAGDGVGAEQQGGVDRHRRDAPPHLCEKQCQLEEAVAAAADVLGQRDSEEVGGREFAPERSVVAHVAGFELGQVFGRGPVFEELARDLGDRLLFFGEREVHVSAPRLPGRAELVQHEVLPSVSNVW